MNWFIGKIATGRCLIFITDTDEQLVLPPKAYSSFASSIESSDSASAPHFRLISMNRTQNMNDALLTSDQAWCAWKSTVIPSRAAWTSKNSFTKVLYIDILFFVISAIIKDPTTMLSKMLVFVYPKSMILSKILYKMEFFARIFPGLRLYF